MEDRSGLGPLDEVAGSLPGPGVTRGAHKAGPPSSLPEEAEPAGVPVVDEAEVRAATFRGLRTLERLIKAAWPSSRHRSIALKALEDVELRLNRATEATPPREAPPPEAEAS